MKLNCLFQIIISILISTLINFQFINSYFIESSLQVTPSKSNFFSNKLRFARYGDVTKCGKRKANIETRRCFRQCKTDVDCRGVKKRCLCDGECGSSCVRYDQTCKKIENFENGRIFYNPDNLFGGHLIYECDPGYKLVGNRIRVCEGDGWWSGSNSSCVKEVFCENPPMIPNAMPNIQVSYGSRYKMGTEIEYQCDIGYNSNYDLNKSVCQSNGRWSDITFTCTKITCDEPEEIQNGIVRASDYSFSSIIEYRCNLGYTLKSGDYLRECLITGEWSGRKPVCEPVDCGAPPIVQNAFMTYDSTFFKSKVTYKCIDKRYVQDGSINYVECLSNGKWSIDYIPKCLEVNCTINGTQLKSMNAYISTSNEKQLDYNVYPVGTLIEIKCNDNYELIGDKKLTCNINGQWNSSMPTCKLDIYCPVLYAPNHGLIMATQLLTSKGYPFDTVLEFTCSHGYRLIGSSRRKCDKQGQWNGEDALCLELTTKSINNSVISSKTEHDLSIGKIRYDTGLKGCDINLSNDKNSIVMSNQQNSLDQTISSYVEHGSIMNYTCKENSLIQYTAYCSNGSLIYDKKCYEVEEGLKACLAPPKIQNGYLKLGSYLNGSKAIYKCFSGFKITTEDENEPILTCINGQWSGRVPTCAKMHCGYPGELQNGKILYVGSNTEYSFKPYMTSTNQNKQLKYVCDNGFKLIGSSGATCINGNWKPSIETTKCVKDKFFIKKDNNALINPNSLNSVNEPIAYGDNSFILTKIATSATTTQSKGFNKNKIVNLRLDINSDENSVLKEDKGLNNEAAILKQKKSNRKLKRLKKHKIKKMGLNKTNNNSENSIKNKIRKKKNKNIHSRYI